MAVTGIGDYNNAYENVYTEAGFSKNQIFSQGRGFQGVAISPAYLAKAGKNEDTAKDLDEMLSGVEKAYNWLKNSIEKDGNKLISCGYYIDENGKMGSYSVVEKKHSMFDSLEVQSEKDAERIKELRKKKRNIWPFPGNFTGIKGIYGWRKRAQSGADSRNGSGKAERKRKCF